MWVQYNAPKHQSVPRFSVPDNDNFARRSPSQSEVCLVRALRRYHYGPCRGRLWVEDASRFSVPDNDNFALRSPLRLEGPCVLSAKPLTTNP